MSAILFLTFLFHLDLKVRVRRRVCWIIYFFYFTLELLNGYYFLLGWVAGYTQIWELLEFGSDGDLSSLSCASFSLIYSFSLTFFYFILDCLRC